MEIKALQNTVLKRERIDSSLLPDDKKRTFKQGTKFECQSIKNAGHNHWIIKITNEENFWYAYKPHCDVTLDNLITYYHFEKCFKYAKKSDIDTFFQPFNQALEEYQINTIIRIAAFIAQIAHESGSLRYKEELASGQTYEWRKDLGNIYRGDGRRYKGRGLIQLTGRHNYGWASKQLGIDLVSDPQIATQPEISCRIAALYWNSRNLNKYADWNNERGFKIITRKINGGYNGWNDRLKYWKHARKILCC